MLSTTLLGETDSPGDDKKADLSTTENLIVRKIEDVHDELRNRVATDPQEDSLPVLDEEEAVPLQPF